MREFAILLAVMSIFPTVNFGNTDTPIVTSESSSSANGTIEINKDSLIQDDIVGLKLLADLERFVKPHKSIIRDGVIVYFGLSLNHVVHLDETDQTIRMNMKVTMTWVDEFFRWDPDDYEGVDKIVLASHETWQPDLVLVNCVEEEYSPQIDNTAIVVDHTGNVNLTYPISTTILCPVDVTYFPFDQQTCIIEFGSWSYTTDQIDVQLNKDPNITTAYLKNSAWDLRSFIPYRYEELFDCCPKPFAALHFMVTLRRRWSLYSAYFILPNVIMNILCNAQFLLPCDSNERVGLGVSLYLSLVVYLILIESVLPSTEKFPIFVIYIFATLMEISIAEIVSILVLFLHHKGIHDNMTQVKPWMRRLILQDLARLVCMHKFIMSDVVKERLKTAGVVRDGNRSKKEKALKLDDQKNSSQYVGKMNNLSNPNFNRNAINTESSSLKNTEVLLKMKMDSYGNVSQGEQSENRKDKDTELELPTNHSCNVNPNTLIKDGDLSNNVNAESSENINKIIDAGNDHSEADKNKPKQKGLTAKRATVVIQGPQNMLYGTSVICNTISNNDSTKPGGQSFDGAGYSRCPSITAGAETDLADRRLTILRKSNLESSRGILLKSILKLCEKCEERVANDQRSLVIRQEWQQVAMVIDRFMIFFFFAFNLGMWISLITLLYFYTISLKDYPSWSVPDDAV